MNNYFITGLLAVAVSFAQIFLKIGVTETMSVNDISLTRISFIIKFFTNSYIFLGILIYIICALIWLWILSSSDLGKSYIILSLSFIFVPLLSYLFLSEDLSISQFVGIIFIVFGVVMVSSRN